MRTPTADDIKGILEAGVNDPEFVETSGMRICNEHGDLVSLWGHLVASHLVVTHNLPGDMRPKLAITLAASGMMLIQWLETANKAPLGLDGPVEAEPQQGCFESVRDAHRRHRTQMRQRGPIRPMAVVIALLAAGGRWASSLGRRMGDGLWRQPR